MTKSPPAPLLARHPAVSVKMSDIAQLAGVSESTISRALSNSPLVGKETRERIKSLAEELGYTIDKRARNLRVQQSGVIAVVVPLLHDAVQSISDPFFLEMLGNLADILSTHGYDLLLRKFSAVGPQQLAGLLRDISADGVLLIGQSTQHDAINRIAETYTPMVVWGTPLPGAAYLTVGSDNFNGALQAVSHLLSLGRRRIVFLGNKDLPEVAPRYAGYQAALNRHSVTLNQRLVVPMPFDGSSALQVVRGFLAQGHEFDAVFAASDIIAMAVIRALRERDLRVPEDVAVIGFDDIMLAGVYSPALTTVRQNIPQAAKILVETLIRRIAGEPAESTLLPVELIIRDSCGSRRGGGD
jgi:DNA-binding LacI/PurR family transcriptional regulator